MLINKTKPTYVEVVASEQGWRHAKTGELLVAVKGLLNVLPVEEKKEVTEESPVEEKKEVAESESTPVVEEAPVEKPKKRKSH